MQLANYISDLLYRHDCVIVPNFGGFITNRISAKVNNYTHTFYPPTKQVGFNIHLKHNDGLLVNYVAKAENISFDNALTTINKEVSSWNEQLKSNKVEISSVGNLVLNKENQIVFEPNTEVNYLTESFGLASFESSAISRLKTASKQISSAILPKEKEEKSKVIPLFAKYAATAAILLTLGFAGWNGYEQNQQQKVFAKQQQQIEQKIQEATFVIDNPLPTINLNVSKATPENYHIIAGAFQFPENAEKKVSQLKKQGFDAKIIGKNKWGLTQVTFNSFVDRNDAINNLYRIQDNVSKDAWLLVKKLP